MLAGGDVDDVNRVAALDVLDDAAAAADGVVVGVGGNRHDAHLDDHLVVEIEHLDRLIVVDDQQLPGLDVVGFVAALKSPSSR